ncbi:MAG: hypothetical protein IPL23_19585 [Saprospiraceae bacterium]|nr:hypothetical protein [Saprospiraceae bacterium]
MVHNPKRATRENSGRFEKISFQRDAAKRSKDIEYIKDDKHSAYICFKDDVITVNKDGYSSSKYCNGEKYLTKSEILDKEFSRPIEGKIGDFQKFIYNISGITSDCHDKGLLQIYADQGQTNWLKVGPLVLVYGYLMHTYKDPSKPYAIVVSEDVDDSEKGGGTGKSLAMKAPGHLKKLQEIDGKGFKTNNQFAWSLLDEFTKIGLVNDAPDTFDFSALYNYLSDGFEIEKKGVDRKFIPFESSPKICITTNYSLWDAKSEHQSRRIKTILIRRYYTREFTPEQEFGKTFFYDWNNEEWNAFYDFMLTCLSIYFRCGRNVPNQSGGSNSVKKKIRAEMAPYGDDFISYCESSIFKKIWNVNRKEDEFSPIIQPRTEYTDFKDNAGIFDSRDLNAKVFKDNLIKYINGVIKIKQTTKKKNNKGEEEEDGEYDFIKAPLSLKLNKKAWPLFQKWASDQPWFIPEEADVPF